MVQMKGSAGLSFWKEYLCLYIPHGSDESPRAFNKSSFAFYFISHMVQMKDTKKKEDIMPHFFALYPTWFR